jgi:hypothetical protein
MGSKHTFGVLIGSARMPEAEIYRQALDPREEEQKPAL